MLQKYSKITNTIITNKKLLIHVGKKNYHKYNIDIKKMQAMKKKNKIKREKERKRREKTENKKQKTENRKQKKNRDRDIERD